MKPTCLKQILRKRRNKIVGKLWEEETIFISVFNAVNLEIK